MMDRRVPLTSLPEGLHTFQPCQSGSTYNGGWPLPPCQRDDWRVALTSLPKGFLLAPPQQVPSGTVVGVPSQQVPFGTVMGAMGGGPYLLAKGIVSTALNSAMHSGFCLTAFYTLLPASLLVKPFTPWQDG